MDSPEVQLAALFGRLGRSAVRLAMASSTRGRRRQEESAHLTSLAGGTPAEDYPEADDVPCDCASEAERLRREAAARYGRRR